MLSFSFSRWWCAEKHLVGENEFMIFAAFVNFDNNFNFLLLWLQRSLVLAMWLNLFENKNHTSQLKQADVSHKIVLTYVEVRTLNTN